MTLQVVSLGYERRSVEELINILQDLGVKKLLDIRKRPISRKKGFSKKALSKHLEDAGICYKHVHEAGNPYYGQKTDIESCLQLYADFLESNPQITELIELDISNEAPVALLCYERKHEHCHRSILIEKVRQRGNVIDLITVE